ncbi:MAG: TonB-dependent receptor [Bacteroidales bacterium]|nr:TonB-dependent receptor [Bacteroidales bacterium]
MFFSLLLAAGLQMAAAPDTLQAVTVVADRGVVVSRTDTVRIQSLLDVGGTLLYVPGLYVGDYGSASGLKTASLRGLGSAHTAIYLDGVRVGNVQSGQADLGMLDLASLSNVVIDYAQNSLSFNTARPVFRNRPVAGTAKIAGGSFGTWQPYANVAVKLGERWSLSAHAGGLVTNGKFPLSDGSFRSNNDMKQLQTGIDLFGNLQGGDFHAKIYYNGSDRGTPGSLDWPSTDRQTDRNFGAQAVLKKSFSPLYTLNLSAKGAYDRLFYKSEWGDTDYKQTEFQLNSAHKFHLTSWWEVSLAADVAFDKLNSTLYQQQRWGTVLALATAFRWERFKADLALEYDGTFDKGVAPLHSLSPSADIRFTIVEGLDLVAFGRRAFRAPTFNELYYPGYGNSALKPEDAWMADLGVDFNRTLKNWQLEFRVDGYFNHLTNKIISAPSPDDPNVWMPYNVGKVQALGADVLGNVVYFTATGWMAGITVRYGYQKALDKTPDSYTFNQPIPYVAAHTLIINPLVAYKGWMLGATWNLRAGRRDSVGAMPNWNTVDIQFGKDFTLRTCTLGVRFTVRNLNNCRYETVSGYPMPGRSIMGGLVFNF